MEKVSSDNDKRSSRWINVSTLLTVVQTVTFVGVTVVTFLDVLDLDQKEIDIRHGIQDLQSKLVPSPESKGSDSKEDAEKVLDRLRRHITSRLATRQSSLFVGMLKVQEKILEKHCRDRNKTCPPGPQGDKGTRGQQGLDGLQGPAGFPGLPGLPGQKGLPGGKGFVGSVGLKGESGVNGSLGPMGQNGSRGVDGAKGLKGEPGPNGLKGISGTLGEVGEPGKPGVQGVNKTQGPRGDTGDPGVKGTRGEAGLQGPKGNDSRKFADDCDCFRKPSFIPPSDATLYVPIQSSQDLPCNATGNPVPTVTVQKITSGKRAVASNGGKVSISNAKNSDYGRYVCEAKNRFGSTMKYITIAQPTG